MINKNNRHWFTDILELHREAEYELGCLLGLEDDNPKFSHLGWDLYDMSLEIYEAEDDFRLSEEQQKICYKAGFMIVYVNHKNKIQTHYNFKRGEEFKSVKGWRRWLVHDDKGGIKELKVSEWPDGWGEYKADGVTIIDPEM